MAQSVRSARRKSSRKTKRSLSSGQVHIFATFNNTIITITDHDGNTVAWGSAGSVGFKGSKKSTPYAARLAAEQALNSAKSLGMQEAQLFVGALGLKVTSISDVTPIPHNGCRPPKRRRV